MKTLPLSIIVIFSASLIVTNNITFADTATQTMTVIDGHVSLAGCNVINGIITQGTDIQNTPIQLCNYHNKHFKLSQGNGPCPTIGFGKIVDPDTGQLYTFSDACDIPSTCGLQDSWNGPFTGHSDELPVTTGGNQSLITTYYNDRVCTSESYDGHEKKLTIIANGIWKNDAMIHAIIPKSLLNNAVVIVVDGQKVNPTVTDYPSSNAVPSCQGCYDVIIPLSDSFTTKKIEIGVQAIPEFPFALPMLVAGITSLILLYRIKFKTSI